MNRGLLLIPIAALVTTACLRETPVRVEDRDLGTVAIFPGQPRMHKFTETTPFGDMEWFSTTYETPGRMDRSFFINVGNLPPGDQGGTTEPEVLATFQKFLTSRLGRIDVKDLPPVRGRGFQYQCPLPNGGYSEGIAIVRRGRIHQAQATVAKAEDPAIKAFLDSFAVLP